MIDVTKYQQMIADSTPGRFEGEQPATAYYWESMMIGDGDSIAHCFVFDTTAEERTTFNLTAPHFAIEFDENGCIYGSELSETDYQTLCDEDEQFNDDDDDDEDEQFTDDDDDEEDI